MDVPHRQLAAETYNATWTLLESHRTAELDRDLLGLAMTSRYHWQQVGGPREQATADWMVSRCFAALGQGGMAVSFGEAALSRRTSDFPAWLCASLHEGLARACDAAGNAEERDRHIQAAREELAREADQDDRAVIAAQLEELVR